MILRLVDGIQRVAPVISLFNNSATAINTVSDWIDPSQYRPDTSALTADNRYIPRCPIPTIPLHSKRRQRRTFCMPTNPKTIATINFKGGVGKTTVTWCLGDVVSALSDARVLLFDLDAQMSLTQAIALNEDGYSLEPRFQKWYESSIAKKKTIFDALEKYTTPAQHFDFPIGFDFIYNLTEVLHFVPSVEDLYWMELEVFDRDSVKDFVRRLLGKITNSPKLPDYDYILFDCPPSFTLLSYSVLSCCDLILIPVNPDYFASKGTNLILNSLKMRIEPFPLPRIGVFMNKTKTWRNAPTREALFYIREIERVCDDAAKQENIDATFLHSWIPERVGVKRAITAGGVPAELVDPFKNLWNEIVEYVR